MLSRRYWPLRESRGMRNGSLGTVASSRTPSISGPVKSPTTRRSAGSDPCAGSKPCSVVLTIVGVSKGTVWLSGEIDERRAGDEKGAVAEGALPYRAASEQAERDPGGQREPPPVRPAYPRESRPKRHGKPPTSCHVALPKVKTEVGRAIWRSRGRIRLQAVRKWTSDLRKALNRLTEKKLAQRRRAPGTSQSDPVTPEKRVTAT